MQAKRVAPNPIDNIHTEPRSSYQSCHLTKSKPLISTTPLQQQKPNNLIQSLNGLCKYFIQKEDSKQIACQAPKSIQRSSASLSPRQIIAAPIQENNSPLLVKQLLYGKKDQKENLNPKVSVSKVDQQQVPHLSINQEQKLVKVNDSSHKKSMGKFAKNQKSRNASVQYHEDWKLKYEELQLSLCERIQQLENELENMERNRKIDQMHSDQQTNQYIEQLQSIIQEKDQKIWEQELQNEKLQKIIESQQQDIQKYMDNKYKLNESNNEMKRLQQVDQKFEQIRGHLPALNITLKNIQQLFDVGQFEQQQQQNNNLSLSSVSMVEMINDFNKGIEEKTQKSFKNNNIQTSGLLEPKTLNLSEILKNRRN
ncbi:unnamed protein product [Paramecium sonneborni]|uniref:Uncharacterized protein n=1 Tax=Paramecium sonneborni TaxID=65129 RepID=A0A8S1P2K7_9CILI|nr:unnamed protein product [Paramecium sonneborni]